jgi:hypothetical protein
MSSVRESIFALRAIYTKIAWIAAERNQAHRKALALCDRNSISAGSNVISFVQTITGKAKRADRRP